VDEAGKVFRQESRIVITYGIALMLYDVVEWLNTIFPERAGGRWLLRPP